jgi:hypothetical protein
MATLPAAAGATARRTNASGWNTRCPNPPGTCCPIRAAGAALPRSHGSAPGGLSGAPLSLQPLAWRRQSASIPTDPAPPEKMPRIPAGPAAASGPRPRESSSGVGRQGAPPRPPPGPPPLLSRPAAPALSAALSPCLQPSAWRRGAAD